MGMLSPPPAAAIPWHTPIEGLYATTLLVTDCAASSLPAGSNSTPVVLEKPEQVMERRKVPPGVKT